MVFIDLLEIYCKVGLRVSCVTDDVTENLNFVT